MAIGASHPCLNAMNGWILSEHSTPPGGGVGARKVGVGGIGIGAGVGAVVVGVGLEEQKLGFGSPCALQTVLSIQLNYYHIGGRRENASK